MSAAPTGASQTLCLFMGFLLATALLKLVKYFNSSTEEISQVNKYKNCTGTLCKSAKTGAETAVVSVRHHGRVQ